MAKKYKLHPKVSCINTVHGVVKDHKKELKETDFPEGNAAKLVKAGYIVEVGKPKAEPKAKKEEK